MGLRTLFSSIKLGQEDANSMTNVSMPSFLGSGVNHNFCRSRLNKQGSIDSMKHIPSRKHRCFSLKKTKLVRLGPSPTLGEVPTIITRVYICIADFVKCVEI